MFATIAAWFTNSWASIVPWVLGIGAAILAAFSLRQSGKDAAYVEIAKQQLLQANQALTITQDVAHLSDADVSARLHDQFAST